MPDLYFNPYPSACIDIDEGKRAFIATAIAVESLKCTINDVCQADGDGIGSFSIVRDDTLGCSLNLHELLPSISGKDRVVTQLFLLMFSKGKIIDKTSIEDSSRLILAGLELSAPILEYALLNQGVSATISPDPFWQVDFFSFSGTIEKLPNVWGQADLAPIFGWLSNWQKENTKLLDQIRSKFSAIISKSAIKEKDLSPDEWTIIIDTLAKAKIRNYLHDGFLVKDVGTTLYGPLKQIKQLGSGLRVYLACNNTQIIIGGFYKKGVASSPKREAIAQNKAIIAARDRINSHFNIQVTSLSS